MVGKLGCGCCGGYCAGSTTGSFADSFNPPFLTPYLPLGDFWSWSAARDDPPGNYMNDFEGWQRWYSYNTLFAPWKLVNTTGKFHLWPLREPGQIGSGFPPYWSTNSISLVTQDECVYSANYRIAKYKSEITVAVPVSKAPIYPISPRVDQGKLVTGPMFVFTGPFGTEKDLTLRKIGPRIAIGMRRDDDGVWLGPWYNWFMILDKYTTGSDDNFVVANAGFTDTILQSKPTYKLGIEIECINRESYGLAPGPLFRGTCFIDDVQVYQNTYGPFVDTGADLLGGANNWRPNGHCRCMIAGRVFGSWLGHPMWKYSQPSSGVASFLGWNTDTTTDFWADNFTFTETLI